MMKALWVVKFCCLEKMINVGNDIYLMVPFKKATANYVPAAAVIRRWRALSGFIGRKGCAGGLLSLKSNLGAQPHSVLETDRLEYGRGKWNS